MSEILGYFVMICLRDSFSLISHEDPASRSVYLPVPDSSLLPKGRDY